MSLGLTHFRFLYSLSFNHSSLFVVVQFHLLISICVLWIYGVLLFGLINMFFKLQSSMFDLYISVEIEANYRQLKPNLTRPMVIYSSQQV